MPLSIARFRQIACPIENVLSLCQFSEELDGANHLAGVAVLVVVPGNNLYFVQIISDLGNHGLSCIEQRTILHTDNVRRYDRLFVVAIGLSSSSLHSSIDAVNSYVCTLNNSGQDGGGTSVISEIESNKPIFI